MKIKFTRKRVFLAIAFVMMVFTIKPAGFLLITWLKDEEALKTEMLGFSNDASRLNKTRIGQKIIPSENSLSAERQIIALIRQAKREGKKISIAGAQHSMGGHTILNDGILLDMQTYNHLRYDPAAKILHAGAGARWSDVIPYLNNFGKSVSVMQSNNSFSLGGSASVNCHGWTPESQPFSANIRSLRLITAEGKVITCSREMNAELFSLVLGGYGLFGVILDLDLEVSDNVEYTTKQYTFKSDEYVSKFSALVKGKKDIGMAYGRINITKENFMEEAILSTYSIKGSGKIYPLKENGLKTLRRTIFRGSAGSNYGKQLRWDAEKFMTKIIDAKTFTRNQLMNEDAGILQNHDRRSTDILHEYFIPAASLNEFVKFMKREVPKFNVDLLNITIRDVKKDETTFLRYADKDVFGFVLLFNQLKTDDAENEMIKCTQRLIDGALALNGSYYLPYRLHATREQFYKVYPNAAEFFKLKNKYDPDHIFQNQFYLKYK